MIPKPFSELWTLSTVEQILKDFLWSQESFLCKASTTFQALWQVPQYRETLIELAIKFRPDNCTDAIQNVLFLFNGGFPSNFRRDIRIAFLKHEIARLFKQSRLIPFNELWTLDTVKQIQREFQAEYQGYLCLGSNTFKEFWDVPTYRKELLKLAIDFRPDNLYRPDNDLKVLFDFSPAPAGRWERNERLRFLEHEVNRLSSTQTYSSHEH